MLARTAAGFTVKDMAGLCYIASRTCQLQLLPCVLTQPRNLANLLELFDMPALHLSC